jgi:ketosteroid isomerase-like protein
MTRTLISVVGAVLAVASTGGIHSAQREQGNNSMHTRQIVEAYFGALQKKAGWQDALANDMVFTSYTSPVRHVSGKDAYLAATERFYSTIAGFEVRQLVVEGEHAIALTHYTIQPPDGAPSFASDVAESFRVRGGKIVSFDIYFDTAPYPK